MWPPRPASTMSGSDLIEELNDVTRKWDDYFLGDFEGHGGSPGEWMFERMNELETELIRRIQE